MQILFLFFSAPNISLVCYKSSGIFTPQIQLPFLQRLDNTCVKMGDESGDIMFLSNIKNMTERLNETFQVMHHQKKLNYNKKTVLFKGLH